MVLKRSVAMMIGIIALAMSEAHQTRRILVDTDVDTDDVFALFYLLKQNKSEFDLQAISINTNGWSDGGHAVNYVYDILFMMDRDDIPVGVGGGFQPIIDQGTSTSGSCRYRQAIPVGQHGRLDVDTNFGLRRSFLPQGERRYIPLEQATAQEVMKKAISSGPITIFLMGSHTNLATLLITNPEMKKNIQHIYAMGGSLSTINDDDHIDIGNLYPKDTNPFAEFNFFADPLAAYLVLHSGIPMTLVPLDATKTIPVDENFFSAFENNQHTYEAQYCFQTLKMARDTWVSNNFYKEYCMWDSFMVGVALSQMRIENEMSNNEFALMEYVNITVVTSNEPYGVSDGSNPLTHNISMSTLLKVNESGFIHTGHVQTGMSDQFCQVKGSKGKCQDGYTKRVSGEEGVRVLIAKEAKPNSDNSTSLAMQFYKSYLDVMNREGQSGRFNITTQFKNYRADITKKPGCRLGTKRKLKGKLDVVLDIDMSPGDFLALFYLLKLPPQLVDIKGILISGNGWANAATIDTVYDILHMMGRNDIPVGLGNVFALAQSLPAFPAIGDCSFTKYIPQGPGGFLDSDTLYGHARLLPRSPRTYTAEKSVEFRQPSSLEVWKSAVDSLDPGAKITVLTNGPLTNLAEIIDQSHNITSLIQDVYIVGGPIRDHNDEKGNLLTIPSNIFLDPLAASKVLGSNLSVTFIPFHAQKQVSSFNRVFEELNRVNKTPELEFSRLLILTLKELKQKDEIYGHLDMFLGEIIGAVVLGSDIEQVFEFKAIKILGDQSVEIEIDVDETQQGKKVRILERVNSTTIYENFAKLLGDEKRSAVVGSFLDQTRLWSEPPKSPFQGFNQAIKIHILVGSIVLILWFAVRFRNKGLIK